MSEVIASVGRPKRVIKPRVLTEEEIKKEEEFLKA